MLNGNNDLGFVSRGGTVFDSAILIEDEIYFDCEFLRLLQMINERCQPPLPVCKRDCRRSIKTRLE